VDVPNESGICALHFAAKYGRPDDLKSLLTAGADVNATNRTGLTPLIYAANEGWDDCVALLIEAKADTAKETHKGRTALCAAETKARQPELDSEEKQRYERLIDLLKKTSADAPAEAPAEAPAAASGPKAVQAATQTDPAAPSPSPQFSFGCKPAAAFDANCVHNVNVEASKPSGPPAELLLAIAPGGTDLVKIGALSNAGNALGTYKLLPTKVNGKPAWMHAERSQNCLWFSDSRQHWAIGKTSELGGTRCIFMTKSKSEAASPDGMPDDQDDSASLWKVGNSKIFVDVQGMTCTAVAAAPAAAAPAAAAPAAAPVFGAAPAAAAPAAAAPAAAAPPAAPVFGAAPPAAAPAAEAPAAEAPDAEAPAAAPVFGAAPAAAAPAAAAPAAAPVFGAAPAAAAPAAEAPAAASVFATPSRTPRGRARRSPPKTPPAPEGGAAAAPVANPFGFGVASSAPVLAEAPPKPAAEAPVFTGFGAKAPAAEAPAAKAPAAEAPAAEAPAAEVPAAEAPAAEVPAAEVPAADAPEGAPPMRSPAVADTTGGTGVGGSSARASPAVKARAGAEGFSGPCFRVRLVEEGAPSLKRAIGIRTGEPCEALTARIAAAFGRADDGGAPPPASFYDEAGYSVQPADLMPNDQLVVVFGEKS